MFTTLRNNLLFSLAPLLAVMVRLGVWAIARSNHLGQRIDAILGEDDNGVLKIPAGMPGREEMENIRSHREGRPTLAFATLALGIVFFGLFYGLVLACDRL